MAEIAKLNDRVAEHLAIAQRKQRKKATPAEKEPHARPVLGADAQQAFEARSKPTALPDKTKTRSLRYTRERVCGGVPRRAARAAWYSRAR